MERRASYEGVIGSAVPYDRGIEPTAFYVRVGVSKEVFID